MKTYKKTINSFLEEQKECLVNMIFNTDEIEKTIRILMNTRNKG